MKNIAAILTLTILTLTGCNNSDKGTTHKSTMTADKEKSTSVCSNNNCKAKNKSGELSCKLTTPELQKRKETVLASLKSQMTDKKELENGYAFKFPGTDKILDELTEFIKTERAAHNTGLAKVAVQFSADTFVVKIATFAKPENVSGHSKTTPKF